MMTTYIFSYVHPMDKSIAFTVEPRRRFLRQVSPRSLFRYGKKPSTRELALSDSIIKWVACYRAVEEIDQGFFNGGGNTCSLCEFYLQCQKCVIAEFTNEGGCGGTPYSNAAIECTYNNSGEEDFDEILNEIGFLVAVHRHFYGKLPTPIYNAIPRDAYCRWKNYEART